MSGPQLPPDAEYVDDRDLERITPLKRVTWQLMRRTGKGPRFYKCGRRCLYKLTEVRSWIEGNAS